MHWRRTSGSSLRCLTMPGCTTQGGPQSLSQALRSRRPQSRSTTARRTALAIPPPAAACARRRAQAGPPGSSGVGEMAQGSARQRCFPACGSAVTLTAVDEAPIMPGATGSRDQHVVYGFKFITPPPPPPLPTLIPAYQNSWTVYYKVLQPSITARQGWSAMSAGSASRPDEPSRRPAIAR